MGKGLRYSSGRVIGVGRLLLATLFLLAIYFDIGLPGPPALSTYAFLIAYFAFAAVTVVMTWSDWWLDARIAGPAHAIDIAFFTVLVLVTEGFTSPYFAFFMFVLLSSAIRWGWRSTALSATLLILLYLIAGAVAATSSPEVELQRFVIRTGHLVILSLILIWFGATRWRAHLHSNEGEVIEPPSLDDSPIETNLAAVMAGLGAGRGTFAWRKGGRPEFEVTSVRNGAASTSSIAARALDQALVHTPFLYDFHENRAIRKDSERNLIRFAVTDVISAQTASRMDLSEGLAIPIHAGGADGMMLLEEIRGLSTDHIDLGEQLSADIAAHMQAHALLKATEDRAEARSRLTLARDLHDGVVQFLAGASFRLEAMLRAQTNGREVSSDLDELKQLMLQEQRDLRTFITALRSGPLVGLDDLIRDLKALAVRLSRQWNVTCDFSARSGDLRIPTRLHLDVQQLIREAVANAVRHAEAKSINILLAAGDSALHLEILNDGHVSRAKGGRLQTPMSLKERVEDSGGTFELSRGMDVTKLSISIPISARHP